MRLSVLVPVFNEEETVKDLLDHVLAVPVDKEVVIVDDCSTDKTWSVLQSVTDPRVHIYRHEVNQGKGSGIRTALGHATGDLVIIQDADLEYDPRDYPTLLQPILEKRARVVYGSRFRGGPSKAMFFWHMVGNRFLTFVTNILYNTILTDMETCYKVFTREVSDQLRLKASGWGFDPEITAQILLTGNRIYEVPIAYNGREFNEGKKISWKDGFTVLWTLLKYRITGYKP